MPLILLREPTREDKLFVDLRRAVPKPHKREQLRNAWISESVSSLLGSLGGISGIRLISAMYLTCTLLYLTFIFGFIFSS